MSAAASNMFDSETIDECDLDRHNMMKSQFSKGTVNNSCKIKNMRDNISATFRSPFSPVGMMRSCMINPSLVQYSVRFKEFEPGIMHIGLDDCVFNASKFIMYRQNHGKDIIKEGCNSAAKKFLKTGCPQCLRPAIWKIALRAQDSDCKIIEENKFSSKSSYRKKTNNEIEEFASSFNGDTFNILSDPIYFPFHDEISKTLKRFSSNKRKTEFTKLHNETKHENGKWNFPLCFTPSNRLIYLLAPLSILFENEDDIYHVFQLFYSKFWVRLNVVSANEDIIKYLSKAFENLMISSNPLLFNHILRLNCQPLSIALPWMLTAFSQYLEIGELFHLWDRIIAFDSLDFLPLLASSIFLFRSEVILQYASNKTDIIDILSDGSTIKVIPLLRIIMFPCSI